MAGGTRQVVVFVVPQRPQAVAEVCASPGGDRPARLDPRAWRWYPPVYTTADPAATSAVRNLLRRRDALGAICSGRRESPVRRADGSPGTMRVPPFSTGGIDEGDHGRQLQLEGPAWERHSDTASSRWSSCSSAPGPRREQVARGPSLVAGGLRRESSMRSQRARSR